MGQDHHAGPAAGQRARAVLPYVVLWLLLSCYLLGLARHGEGFDPVVDGWLGSLTTVLPALVLLGAAARRRGSDRRETVLLGTGALAWSLGGVYVVVTAAHGGTLPFPSWADIGFLAFAPPVFAAVAVRVRREAAGRQATVWLDSTLGGLGAASGLAVLLGPVLQGASGSPLAVGVAVAYPLIDLLLVATVVGVAAACGLRPGRSWLWLMTGLLLFAAADVVYALRIAHDAYALGTPLDALWSVGLTCLATGTRRPSAQRAPAARFDGRAALAVPALAMTVALTVLLVGRWVPVAPVATALAALTLLAAALRTQLAFAQVRRLHDLGLQARTDSLTGLGNRRALHEHLRSRLQTGPVQQLAVLFVDLDHFKEINDTLGHHVGDELLRQVGPRLAPVLRPEDLLVRLGGDEFAIVLSATAASGPEQVAQRLLDELDAPFHLDGVPLRIGASVGVALCPQHATDTNGLLQRADVAMYAAKAAGGGVRRYDPQRDQHSRERLHTIEQLRSALDTDQLTVHYQPQCDVANGAPVGVEALVRWQHPTRGLLYPDAFLPLVEQTGLMSALTSTVLSQAVRQCRQWRLDGLDIKVSVNLSASSLLDQRLPDQVAWLLTSNDLPANALTLELTENTLLADPEQCKATLQRLKELGVWLSIDDYGTGYCSLSYLQDLPVDELKLDRVFLTDLQCSRNAAIVRSTIELAHALDLTLVAEGVEDQSSLDLLRTLGCDTAQGYHLSHPLPADAATSWLRERPDTRPIAHLPVNLSR